MCNLHLALEQLLTRKACQSLGACLRECALDDTSHSNRGVAQCVRVCADRDYRNLLERFPSCAWLEVCARHCLYGVARVWG